MAIPAYKNTITSQRWTEEYQARMEQIKTQLANIQRAVVDNLGADEQIHYGHFWNADQLSKQLAEIESSLEYVLCRFSD